MVSYRVMLLFIALAVLNSTVIISYIGEKNLSKATEQVIEILEIIDIILFSIALVAAVATACQLLGWV